MEKILPGKYVEIAYDLFQVEPDGTEVPVHTVEAAEPERFIFGITPGLLIPLERGLEGLEKGQQFSISVPAGEGFPYNPNDVATLDKDIFLDGEGKFDAEAVKPGAHIPMLTAEGFQITGVVLEVTDRHVRMDFNHPLVGKDLLFKGHVVEVRDASPEELHPQGGCCGGSCGSGCGSGCGDSHTDTHEGCCGGACGDEHLDCDTQSHSGGACCGGCH